MRFSCISRCRRFGKSMAAKMLLVGVNYDKEAKVHSCRIESLTSFL